MRLAFMGTPDFAVPALHALHQAGHEIVAVYCQPPRPAGRGRNIRPCAVHQAATSLNLPVFCPEKLKNQEAEYQRFKDLNLDVVVVAAYGLILPKSMLCAPRLGCINIHASLLPRWRGASPIQSAIWAGDHQSGVSIMQMEEGLDTGPVFMMRSVAISDDMTASHLHDDLAQQGAELILETLARLSNDPHFTPEPQSDKGVTYARQLTRKDGCINWTQSATDIDRQIRALTPWPGTYTLLNGQPIKILNAKIVKSNSSSSPGSLIDEGLIVACGEGTALQILHLQPAGKKAMTASEFLNGHKLPKELILGL